LKVLDSVNEFNVYISANNRYSFDKEIMIGDDIMKLYNVRSRNFVRLGVVCEFGFSGKFLIEYKFYWG
jgi:hypothetical protein